MTICNHVVRHYLAINGDLNRVFDIAFVTLIEIISCTKYDFCKICVWFEKKKKKIISNGITLNCY